MSPTRGKVGPITNGRNGRLGVKPFEHSRWEGRRRRRSQIDTGNGNVNAPAFDARTLNCRGRDVGLTWPVGAIFVIRARPCRLSTERFGARTRPARNAGSLSSRESPLNTTSFIYRRNSNLRTRQVRFRKHIYIYIPAPFSSTFSRLSVDVSGTISSFPDRVESDENDSRRQHFSSRSRGGFDDTAAVTVKRVFYFCTHVLGVNAVL